MKLDGDSDDTGDSYEYKYDVEDKPKEQRFDYHADEFWEIIRSSSVLGLTVEEAGLIECLCTPKKVHNANKKLAEHEGFAKIKSVLKDTFAREETVNVSSFLEKIRFLEKAG